jgi:Gpi18-like mannosyltransferase
LLVALATLLLLECALLTAAAVYLVIELLIAVPGSYATAIAVLVLVVLAAVWLAVMAVHTLRGRYWIRGAAVTWQALQIAIGIGSFQGLFARPDIGWLLIIPAVIVIVLLFTPPVVEATKRRDG